MSEINLLDRDVRILCRQLNKGFISHAAVEEILADLPDSEDRAEWFDPEALDEEEPEVPEGEDGEEASDTSSEDASADAG